MTQSEVTCNTA